MRRLLLVLFLFSCSSGCILTVGEEESVPEAPLVPLEVGNRWTYLVTEKTQLTGFRTYRVVGMKDIKGIEAAEIEITTEFINKTNPAPETIYAYNREDGLWWNLKEGGRSVSGTFFQFPAVHDDRYISSAKEMCIGYAESLQIPAGFFEAFIYGDCTNFDDHRTMYAPGVGLLFEGNYEKTAYHLSTFELK